MAEGADFEVAIEAAGYGIFHILLLFVTFFSVSSTVFVTSTMSYIFPSAECFLGLDLLGKGILNASSFAGMILSAIPWGFIADTKGRRIVMLYGCFINAALVLISSFCHNWIAIGVFKFCEGLAICGPFAAVMAYVSEMHGRRFRARAMICVGLMITLASLAIPLLAVIIMPTNWYLDLGFMKYFSWQLFIAVASLPSWITGIVFIFLPESPKFLMSQGRDVEALRVFQFIYTSNHPRSKEVYPIKNLTPEKHPGERMSGSAPKRFQEFLKNLHSMALLFAKEYPWLTLFVCFLNFCILMDQNTFRLWLPEVFHSISGFLKVNKHSSSSLCNIMTYSVLKSLKNRDLAGDDPDKCQVDTSVESFTKNFIVGGTSLLGFLAAIILINRIGGKLLLCISLGLASVMGYATYYTSTSDAIVAISSITVTCMNVSSTAVINASVSLFPTQLRVMIVSLIMMCGRLGSVFGNVLFPVLMNYGCAPPIIFIGTVALVAFICSIFLPNPMLDLK